MGVQELGYNDGVLRDAGIVCCGIEGWGVQGCELQG